MRICARRNQAATNALRRSAIQAGVVGRRISVAIALIATTTLAAGCATPATFLQPKPWPTTACPEHEPSHLRTFGSESCLVRIVVIGDSLSDGNDTPGYPWTIPAQLRLDHSGLPAELVNASAGGIGYLAQGTINETFATLARRAVTPSTGIVVLFGSDNDSAGPELSAAVTATINLVKALAPCADVLVLQG